MLQRTMPACRILLLLILVNTHVDVMAQTATATAALQVPVKKIYDEEAKSWYAVYATSDTIHVYLAVTDPMQQRKIISNGLELWVDTRGKKNKKTGILFPVMVHATGDRPMQGPPPAFNGAGGPESRALPDTNNIAWLKKAIAVQREMKLTGFRNDLNGLQNIDHPSGIQVSLYFIKDTLVYNAQLPINTLPESPALNSRIAICLVEKGMAMPDFGGNGMPPEGGGGGDGMMPPPGGPGGAPPGGEEGMRIFQDNSIWFKFVWQHTGI